MTVDTGKKVDPAKPAVVEQPSDDDYFESLADAVDAHRIRDTVKLARVVSVLNGGKSVSTKFGEAFPDATTKQRDLTDADSKTLRSID